MREIKSAHKNLPVIAQTAIALPCEKDTFLDMGFDDFMVKPIDTSKLFSLINTYCAQPTEI
jgi:DNA-binding response OmpR family regulator